MAMLDAGWVQSAFPDLTGVQPLAEGGQKWVYTATHPSDGSIVLKLVKPNADVERTRREMQAVQAVGSARVPRVLADGIIDTPIGTCWWIREGLIAGESLRAVVSRGPMAIDVVRGVGLHVLEALGDAERVRIVHRDVKPENIMCGNDGQHWLLDFGIARHLDLESLTATSALGGPGTLGYAPPEQMRNRKRDIDARADLFAVGVTLVECLTGQHPFRSGARDAGEVVRRVETQPVVLPPLPGVGGTALHDLLIALTQKRLDCRPASVAEALQWLKETG